MRTNSISKKLVATLMALIIALSLAACGVADVDLDDVDIGDEITVPAPEGLGRYTSWLDDDDDDSAATQPETKTSKAMTKTSLKPYGELVTVVKSVSKPTASDSKNVQDTNYGKVDWSMAAQGYIEFTAKGQERTFILQGPNGAQANMVVQKGEPIKVALMDGTGKYQYAIANRSNGKTATVQCKNSFEVKAIDSDLARYLISTPYGDYANAPDTVKKAGELWDTKKTQLQNVKAIAKGVKDAIDYDKADKVGPVNVYANPDKVIKNGQGVCNEMSKTLAAMPRSQGIPAYVQGGTNARGGAHAWVIAWVELSSEPKNGVTYSTGTWVAIEAVGGSLQTNDQAKSNYTPSAIKG